jgi:hypothetical protein
MGLLSRLREWIAGSGEEAVADETEAAETAATDEATGTDETTEPQLDPENVTEVRAGSADDSVEKLQEVKRAGGDDGNEEDEDRPG